MKITSFNGDLAWAVICYYIIEHKKFSSVTGITYETKIEGDHICYKGGDRNSGEFEAISRHDFIQGFEAIKALPEINTNVIKGLIPNSIYRKRTPFIGILHSAKILK